MSMFNTLCSRVLWMLICIESGNDDMVKKLTLPDTAFIFPPLWHPKA